MIYRHQINALSDEEKGALLYVLNKESKMEVDMDTVTSYKPEAIRRKLKEGAVLVKPENIEFYKKLCNNFNVTL